MKKLRRALAFFARICYTILVSAGMMELADVTDSKSVGSDTVWVRVPPPAPNRNTIRQGGVPLLCKSVAK